MGSVDFLDVTFDLHSNSYRPFRKPNDTPCYIHVQSNHPKHIKKQIPEMIEKRLQSISSSRENFNNAIPAYNEALKNSGYKKDLRYEEQQDSTNEDTAGPDQQEQQTRKRNRRRKRKVIWFNPPYNQLVTTSIGKKFLELIDTHFRSARQDQLQKIFNRHTIKLSYSCAPNMKSIIKAHNNKVLGENSQTRELTERIHNCNCQDRRKCPIP